MIKHDRHLRTRGKWRKHERQASVFYISRAFSNVQSVLSQSNTRLRLLLLYDIEIMWQKTRKRAFSMFYSPIKHGFLTNQVWFQAYAWPCQTYPLSSSCVLLNFLRFPMKGEEYLMGYPSPPPLPLGCMSRWITANLAEFIRSLNGDSSVNFGSICLIR